MSDAAINVMLQRRCRAAGLKGAFSAHSLRAGFLTSAAQAGRRLDAIMRQSRHASTTVALSYVRLAEDERDCAAAGLL
jgi:integrase